MFSDCMLREDHFLLEVVTVSGFNLRMFASHPFPEVESLALLGPVRCGMSRVFQASFHLLTKMSPDIAKHLGGGQNPLRAGGGV